MKRSLMWFTWDLRLDDNPALRLAAEADEMLCVFVVEEGWFQSRRYQYPQMGPHRWIFLQQSLSELNQRLQLHGQRLLVVYGRAEVEISRLVERYDIDRVVRARSPGADELKQWRWLESQYPETDWRQADAATLFEQDQVAGLGRTWPMSFSAFRRQAENWAIPAVTELPKLPIAMTQQVSQLTLPDWLPNARASQSMFDGGESEAIRHLDCYLASAYPQTYKRDRNAIDDWDSSSKLSPWLNAGNLSARRLKQKLDEYDQQHGPSDGTHWLFVELIWREYFQWLAEAIGTKLFHFQGLSEHKPLTSFYSDRFRNWREGNTPWALVNACMRQLKETGYLSNRGRQIAASALVNELSVDWRYGAAWFEYCLVDYDVASNWGNWQYIAGVGTDSRGGRHFNIDKQTELFDADGSFRARWAANAEPQPLDTLDPTGWPIAYR